MQSEHCIAYRLDMINDSLEVRLVSVLLWEIASAFQGIRRVMVHILIASYVVKRMKVTVTHALLLVEVPVCPK